MFTQTNKQSMLLIYNGYRLISIALLFVLFWVDAYNHINAFLYCGALFLYALFGLYFLYVCQARVIPYDQQVLWSGTIDIIVMVILIEVIGYMQSGLGVLLNASVAMLSILLPGRVAIFFASVASSMLLLLNIVQYEYMTLHGFNSFFSTGIYGAGFFATALTALYFANWVRLSEGIAKDRGRELKTMQRLNEYIVERLQYGVIYVDGATQVMVINKSARQLLNKNKVPKNLTLAALSKPLHQKYLVFLTQKKAQSSSGQAIIENPYLQVHFFKASRAMNPAVLIILEDMAVIAQQVQQLKLASLGRFSAGIAHELRNPLGIIVHAVQLMGEQGLNKEDTRFKELIVNNCNRMNAVIQNVLLVSRRKNATFESIDLPGFLQQFKYEFCLINACELHLVTDKVKKKTIVFDKNQLEQVLVILCDNSMHHGRNQLGKVEISIAIQNKRSQIILTITDTGPGIEPQLRQCVFDPFVSSIKTGNGMGLFIAKEICEVNQANLELVETKKGCQFSIAFNQRREIKL